MQVARTSMSMGLGLIVAFALFVLMSALIDMGDTELDTSKAINCLLYTSPSPRD